MFLSINEIVPVCSTQVGSGFMQFFSLWERVLTSAKFLIAGLENWDLLRQVKCRNLLWIHTRQLGHQEGVWWLENTWTLVAVFTVWFLDYPGSQKVPSGNANPFFLDWSAGKTGNPLQLYLHMDEDNVWWELNCSPSFARYGLWFTEVTLASLQWEGVLSMCWKCSVNKDHCHSHIRASPHNAFIPYAKDLSCNFWLGF